MERNANQIILQLAERIKTLEIERAFLLDELLTLKKGKDVEFVENPPAKTSVK